MIRSPRHSRPSFLPDRTTPTKRSDVYETGGTPNSQFAADCADLGAGALYFTEPQADGTMDVYAARRRRLYDRKRGGATVQNNDVWLHGVPVSATTLHLDGPNGTSYIDLVLHARPTSSRPARSGAAT